MSAACPIERWSQAAPERTALVHGGRRWTWATLEREVRRWACALRGAGLRPGARVAVLSHNRAELVPAFFGCGRAGGVWMPLNARLTAQEVAALGAKASPHAWLVDDALASLLPVGASSVRVREALPEPGDLPVHAPSPDDVRAILFTSGTTGTPRAAQLTWGNFDASAEASAANIGGAPEHVWLAALPLFHIGGLAMVHRCAVYGATLVLQERFDPAAVWRALEEEGVTHLSVVTTALQRLLEVSGDPAPRTLQAVLVGGGPVPPHVMVEARRRGFPVLQTYGLTETCSQVATERPRDADGTSAGAPLRGTQMRIVDPSRAVLPATTVGEIEVRGPTVMLGYVGEPPLAGGWLKTGDLGALDAAGRLTVASRRTDLIITGGENVYPAEVEALLATHPDLAEAAVVGVEDGKWGQVPVALVVPRAGKTPDAEELTAFCRARAAGFKVPRRFQTAADLPRTGSGKVDRAAVRALLSAKTAGARSP